jgi:hypothetical protein
VYGQANSRSLNKYPASCRTRRFTAVAVFIRALHWSLSWSEWVLSISPHHISLRYILILFSHVHISIFSGFIPSSFPINCSLLSHQYYIPWPFNLPWFHYYNNMWQEVQVLKLLIMQFSPATCHFLLRPNFPLNALFSNTLSVCSSLNVRDQVPHP